MLIEHSSPARRVLDRHLPAAEVGQLRAERNVLIVQGGSEQRGHRHTVPTAGRTDRNRAGARIEIVLWRAALGPGVDTIVGMSPVSLVDQGSPIGATVVVIGVLTGPDGPELAAGAKAVDAALGRRLLAAVKAAGLTGEAGETAKIPPLGLVYLTLVVANGLGSRQ